MPQTSRPPGVSGAGIARGLGAPQRVADLVRLGEHVAEHVLPGRAARSRRSAVDRPASSRPARSGRHARSGSIHSGRARILADHGAGPDLGARADHRARLDAGAVADAHALGEHALDDAAVGADDARRRAAPSARPQRRCRPSSDARARVCGPMCAPAIEAAVADQRAGLVARRAASTRRGRRAGRRSPRGSARASRCRSSSPRRRSRRARCRPAAGTPRARTRRRGRPGSVLDHLALEHVGAGVDAVGRHRAVGLLEERLDAAVGVGRARRRSSRCPRPRSARASRARRSRSCCGELGGQVDVGQHVAVEHQQPLVEQALVVARAAPGRRCRAAPPRSRSAAACRRRCRRAPLDAVGEEAAGEDHLVDAVARAASRA